MVDKSKAKKTAETLVEKAKKHMKRGLFKRPSPDEASLCLKKAAKQYHIAGSYPEAVSTWEYLAEIYEGEGLDLSSATSFKKAAQLSQNLDDASRTCALWVKAGEHFQMAGKTVEGANCYIASCAFSPKGGSSDGMERGLELLREEGKTHQAAEPALHLVEVMASKGPAHSAFKAIAQASVIYREIKQLHNVDRLCLLGVIVALKANDEVSAEDQFSSFVNFGSDEAAMAEELMDCFRAGDAERLAAAKKMPGKYSLTNEMKRILNSLSLSGEGSDGDSIL
eukprot:gnl/Dysnectes_brevis/3307_a4153_1476.p1 GENE.gnl/Dysnectes_brevis/3307_a4153_1476~~gnl/Dysnectes_brevis/3307_a4153_1476.p1  ORF type:complete len:281 (+),score=42.62 gnl/Dysnectes_brevis/3307_a4153_1476:47-889(+)